MNYGMSEELGPVVFGDHHEMVFLGREISEQKNYSEEVAKKIDDEVSKLMMQGLKTATEMLNKYRK
jgi:cell division protease FtsH